MKRYSYRELSRKTIVELDCLREEVKNKIDQIEQNTDCLVQSIQLELQVIEEAIQWKEKGSHRKVDNGISSYEISKLSKRSMEELKSLKQDKINDIEEIKKKGSSLVGELKAYLQLIENAKKLRYPITRENNKEEKKEVTFERKPLSKHSLMELIVLDDSVFWEHEIAIQEEIRYLKEEVAKGVRKPFICIKDDLDRKLAHTKRDLSDVMNYQQLYFKAKKIRIVASESLKSLEQCQGKLDIDARKGENTTYTIKGIDIDQSNRDILDYAVALKDVKEECYAAKVDTAIGKIGIFASSIGMVASSVMLVKDLNEYHMTVIQSLQLATNDNPLSQTLMGLGLFGTILIGSICNFVGNHRLVSTKDFGERVKKRVLKRN